LNFGNTLHFADDDLPRIVAWIVPKAYLGWTSRIEDIVDNIESANPLKYKRPRLSNVYCKKIDASESCTIDRAPPSAGSVTPRY